MSVIAWDGTFLAADTGAVNGDLMSRACKIRLHDSNGAPLSPGHPTVLACTGDLGPGLLLMDWYERGANPDDWPKFQGTEDWARLVVASNGKCWTYEKYPVALPVRTSYAAFGSGRDFAMGAMWGGANARGAVEAAITWCTTCGGGVECFNVGAVK